MSTLLSFMIGATAAIAVVMPASAAIPEDGAVETSETFTRQSEVLVADRWDDDDYDDDDRDFRWRRRRNRDRLTDREWRDRLSEREWRDRIRRRIDDADDYYRDDDGYYRRRQIYIDGEGDDYYYRRYGNRGQRLCKPASWAGRYNHSKMAVPCDRNRATIYRADEYRRRRVPLERRLSLPNRIWPFLDD